MIINTLKIGHLRNIELAELSFSPKINLVTGGNGAGKTTLLEAIYLLARAKSFRTGRHRSPIQTGYDTLALYATGLDQHNLEHRIGLERKGSTSRIKIDGRWITRLSDLATTIPIALVTPISHRIIEEGPENRRRLLNWGVFHVEHEFRSTMSDFLRSLLQRNNALRSGGKDMDVWDRSYIRLASSVSHMQERYVERWKEQILGYCSKVDFLRNIEVSFFRGWSAEHQLKEVVDLRSEKEREVGYTLAGPHRADLVFQIEGRAARERLSRGQQKILIAIVLLSQASIMDKVCGVAPCFLFDDLASELDEGSIDVLCRLLDEYTGQVFVTSIDEKALCNAHWSSSPKLFHVEHGSFD